ncbi:MAG: hypothetical protein ACYDCO_15855 [Armatimonadota bacterium]
MAFTILMITVIGAVAGLAVREIVLATRKSEQYPMRRLTLRIVMAVMLIFLLASVLVGVRVYGLDKPQGIIALWMAFWGCITLLSGAIVCLAIADLRRIGDETFGDTNHLWHDIAQTIAEHEQQRSQAAGTPTTEGTDATDADRHTPDRQ